MAESNMYVENPANKPMHYGDKPPVGLLNLGEKAKEKKLYSYFEGQQLYNQLENDIWVQSNKAKPKKKGIPKIIKLFAGAITAGILLLFGAKGFKAIISKFKH